MNRQPMAISTLQPLPLLWWRSGHRAACSFKGHFATRVLKTVWFTPQEKSLQTLNLDLSQVFVTASRCRSLCFPFVATIHSSNFFLIKAKYFFLKSSITFHHTYQLFSPVLMNINKYFDCCYFFLLFFSQPSVYTYI